MTLRSYALVSLVGLKQNSIRAHLVRSFTHTLGAEPTFYEWQRLPKGYLLEMGDGSAWKLPRDFAEVWAYNESANALTGARP